VPASNTEKHALINDRFGESAEPEELPERTLILFSTALPEIFPKRALDFSSSGRS
jgi:hypothetical protein